MRDSQKTGSGRYRHEARRMAHKSNHVSAAFEHKLPKPLEAREFFAHSTDPLHNLTQSEERAARQALRGAVYSIASDKPSGKIRRSIRRSLYPPGLARRGIVISSKLGHSARSVGKKNQLIRQPSEHMLFSAQYATFRLTE